MSAPLLLVYGDRVCPECDGDGWVDDYFQDCERCEGKGHLTEADNINVDLRPYMSRKRFRRFMLLTFGPDDLEYIRKRCSSRSVIYL